MFASIYIFHKIYQMDFLKNNHILVSIFLTINSIKKIYINNNLYTVILLLFFKFSDPKSYSFLLFSLREPLLSLRENNKYNYSIV
jgi:hypothetical protein